MSMCEECPKSYKVSGETMCSVYFPEGMQARIRTGYCPATERYADWREKPKEVVVKKRVGQRKQAKKGATK